MSDDEGYCDAIHAFPWLLSFTLRREDTDSIQRLKEFEDYISGINHMKIPRPDIHGLKAYEFTTLRDARRAQARLLMQMGNLINVKDFIPLPDNLTNILNNLHFD